MSIEPFTFLKRFFFPIGILCFFAQIDAQEKWPYGTVHIIGDSNTAFAFTTHYEALPTDAEVGPGAPRSITYETGFFDDPMSSFHSLKIPYAIHWVQGRTMHRVGRDKTGGFNIHAYRVRENDVVVFMFGSIDQGGHIYKQVIQGRELEEIIDTLVIRYLATIAENRKFFHRLKVVILAVLPPRVDADSYFVDDFHKSYPGRNFLHFQANVTWKLNQKLELESKKHGFLYLNINELLETEEGGLKKELSDGGHHMHPKYNFLMKERLVSLLLNSPLPFFSNPPKTGDSH